MSHPQLATDATGAQVVDLMSLLGRCLGNFKMVERVISTFRVTGQSDLEQLQQAIEATDYQAVSDISHRFRGAASNVSAGGLRDLLAQAERLGHERNHDELLMILGRLQPEWEEFERYSQAFAPATGQSTREPGRHAPASLETSHAGARC